MLPQIFTFVDSSKTQKLKYLENETLFFLQIKLFIQYILVAIMWQNNNNNNNNNNDNNIIIIIIIIII